MSTLDNSLLNKSTEYPQSYDPTLLFPVERALQRRTMGIEDQQPFHGADIWNAYELSWLDLNGKPIVACAIITIPCTTTHIIESKSLKLYFNSFNNEKMSSPIELQKKVIQDLSNAAGDEINFQFVDHFNSQTPHAQCLDHLNIETETYTPYPAFLKTNEKTVKESLVSHLLKTNCPVTGQPDWATLYIHYEGQEICHKGLLQYIISYRNHQDFHEHCVESIYMDILKQCRPEKLTVYARYTRRGGLDINPFRSNFEATPENNRAWRQ